MTSRQHARSKKHKGPATPRTFAAATGLTGATPEELAKRAAITAAAMAAAERSERKAAKRAKLVRELRSTPRALPPAPVDSVRELSWDEPEEAEMPSPWVPARAAEHQPPSDEVSPEPPSEPKAPQPSVPWKGPIVPMPVRDRGPADRPPRVFKLAGSEPSTPPNTERAGETSAATTGLADGLSIAEALRAEGRRADKADKGAASDGTGASTSRRIRVRLPTGAGRSGRRPTTGSRADAPSSARWVSSLRTLPLVDQKDQKADLDSGSTEKKPPTKPLASKARAGQAPVNKKKAESKRDKKKKRKKAPPSPVERRRRIPVALAAIFAVAVLATSFPLSSILGQHSQLSAASAQLAQVQHQNKALTQQQEALKSNVAINDLARSDYQMVTPGQTLYVVLPASQKTTATSVAPTSGDPGTQPLVAPNNAPDLSPQQELPTPIPATAADSTGTSASKGTTATDASNSVTAPAAPSSYWGRVANTLEFWK